MRNVMDFLHVFSFVMLFFRIKVVFYSWSFVVLEKQTLLTFCLENEIIKKTEEFQ